MTQGPPDGAREQPASVTVYTASTCGPCVRLKRALAETDISFVEVNIEHDDVAAEWVVSVNGGERTVPTVLFEDGHVLTNPSAAEVAQHLGNS